MFHPHDSGKYRDLIRQVGNYDNAPTALGYSYLYYVNGLYRSGSVKELLCPLFLSQPV